jgi:hypothetical protein
LPFASLASARSVAGGTANGSWPPSTHFGRFLTAIRHERSRTS